LTEAGNGPMVDDPDRARAFTKHLADLRILEPGKAEMDHLLLLGTKVGDCPRHLEAAVGENRAVVE
jgi:hypothetical protein